MTAPAPIIPRPDQIKLATALDHAIWNKEGGALAVAPVAGGKTIDLILTSVMAVDRGYSTIIVSRSGVIAEQSLKTLARMRPDISGGLYTGQRKAKDVDILFATAKTLAGHLDIVSAADLVLIDECDQAFIRDSTKEYSAIITAARRYAGATGTPFVLLKGRTVPIFGKGKGKTFNAPCYLLTKVALRDLGFFHFIEAAPVAPSRVLKIDYATKVDLGGDFDTKVQAVSAPMLTAIAEDTKAAMGMLPTNAQFLFFGSTTAQCDAQREAFKAIGLNVECFHNKVSSWEQRDIEARFRAGEIQGLCTVSKVNRGFDCPAVSLVVVGFGTASRSKFEQMCGRAQRVDEGKTAAWLLDYGKHGERFGSANWDYREAIEFDRREKLRAPLVEIAEAIRANRRDPKCECTPDRFMDFIEGAIDLFDIVFKVHHARTGNVGARISYVHSMGITTQTIYPGAYAARMLRFLLVPKYRSSAPYSPPPANIDELMEALNTLVVPTHVILRRVFDSYHGKIVIAPVGFRRSGGDVIFDDKPAVTEEWLRHRAHDRVAYADA